MRVRAITLSDVPTIVDLMEATHAERALSNEPFERALVEAHVSGIAHGAPGHEIFICETNAGKIIGYLKGFLSKYFYNHHVRAVHQVIYVAPPHRGSKAAFLLLKEFAVWGVRNKAINIACAVAVEEKKAVAQFDKLMKHLGFVEEGRFYRKAVASVR